GAHPRRGPAISVHPLLPGGKVPEQGHRRQRLGPLPGTRHCHHAWVFLPNPKHGPRGRGHTPVLPAARQGAMPRKPKINLRHMKSKPSSVRMFPFSGKDGFVYVFFSPCTAVCSAKTSAFPPAPPDLFGGGDPGPVWLCHTGGHADSSAQRPPGFGRGVHPTTKHQRPRPVGDQRCRILRFYRLLWRHSTDRG